MGNDELPVIQYIKDGTKVYSVPYYDIGDFFETTNSKNPRERWGYGTWELYGKGKVITCIDSADTDFNSVGKTGGEKSHKLTRAEMPSHTHAMRALVASTGNSADATRLMAGYGIWGNMTNVNQDSLVSDGGNEPHNNMPPYIVSYRWIRTA